MTKKELKQEAEQDAGNVSGFDLSTSLMVTKNKTDAYRLGRFDGYLAGAEPREKRIEELEKEIEEIKKTYRKQRNKRIDELQKANAELTKDMASAVPLLEKATVISDLLNKAIDLIKWFVWYFREGSPNLVPYKHKVEEAEQFLKDCEVEK